MNREAARKLADTALDGLAKQLEAGKSEQLRQYLKVMARFTRYSVGNAILIALQRPNATHVAGYRAWQRLGRQVKTGEKGIAILAPIVARRRRADAEEEGTEDDGETVRSFRAAHVFDISQTEGKPLAEPVRVGGDPGEYLSRLKGYVDGLGIELEVSTRLGLVAEGASAGGRIILRSGLEPAEELSTLSHELAHELLHQGDDATPDKKVRETEAEAVAFVVCQGIGLETSSASSDYIQLHQGDKQLLLKSLQRIRKTASAILNAITVKEEAAVAAESGGEQRLAEAA